MANLTIVVPDDKVADLAAAIEAAKGREEGETDADMAKRHIRAFLQGIYKWHKGRLAKAAAEVDAADDITMT